MLKYSLAALALKAFSLNAPTRRLYRQIGNTAGGKRREHGEISFDAYGKRGDLLVDLYRKYENIKPDDRLLELGTGWMHWYAIYLRLAYECRITTFDIWDNRQFKGMQACLARLPDRTPLLDEILATRNFDELYEVVGFEHVIAPDGQLDRFADDSFTSAFSIDVLEHVPAKSVQGLIDALFRTMKSGHHTIHHIGIDDHLAHYDSSVSQKKYISYSHRTWAALFENQVQYINRLQPSDWIDIFERSGFEFVHREQASTHLNDLTVSKDFQHYPEEDLACTSLTLVFRKP